MGSLLVGTSGYDYAEWRDVFYPARLRKDDFLAYYAEQFNALELNFSYYAIPKAAQLERMSEVSGGKLKFSVKGNQEFTHHIEVGRWRGAVKEFRESLSPFIKRDVLAAVLLQFPQGFHYEKDTRRFLADLTGELAGLPLVVEFRHDSWLRESVFEELDRRGVGLCLCDMPKISRLPAFKGVVTGNTANMRFHGRNAGGRYGTDARERYNYLYSENELKAYAAFLLDVSSKARLTQVYFNNHAKGAAAVNARKMALLLCEGAV
jgi:uncharacterized protein YecE (DUF72 family)